MDVVSEKFGLNFEPFFLLRESVETRGDFGGGGNAGWVHGRRDTWLFLRTIVGLDFRQAGIWARLWPWWVFGGMAGTALRAVR